MTLKILSDTKEILKKSSCVVPLSLPCYLPLSSHQSMKLRFIELSFQLKRAYIWHQIMSTQHMSHVKGRKVNFHWRLSSIKGRLPSKVVFCQRSSSVKGRLPSKVVFCQRLSSVKGRLPLKVVFRRRFLPGKVFFHQRSSSFKGRLPSKVVFSQRSSSVKDHLLSKDIQFYFIQSYLIVVLSVA